MQRTAVVGIDASKNSEDALVWAAEWAVGTGADLEVVHALDHSVWGLDLEMDQMLESEGSALLARQAELVEHLLPTLHVRTTLIAESPARALIGASQRAVMVVVGSGPASRFGRPVTGSRAYQVAAAAYCPVAVVPAIPPVGAHGVVVGVDGSPHSIAAVALAAREADRMGDELRVVHAWSDPALLSDAYLDSGFSARARESERVVLAEAAAGLAGCYPDLRVEQVLVEGAAGDAILAAADQARLVVVGSRGHKGLTRILLGSVSHDVLLASPCPVVVARTHARPSMRQRIR